MIRLRLPKINDILWSNGKDKFEVSGMKIEVREAVEKVEVSKNCRTLTRLLTFWWIDFDPSKIEIFLRLPVDVPSPRPGAECNNDHESQYLEYVASAEGMLR